MKVDSLRARSRKKGFMLIELITVITIMAILVGLLFPTITGFLKRGQLVQSMNRLTQISKAYFQFRSDNKGRNLPLRISKNPSSGQDAVFEVTTVYHLAYEFAWRGYLNESIVYQIPTDLHVEQQGVIPQAVAERDSADAPRGLSEVFSSAPVSFDLVAGLSYNAPSSTPVALTRGLDPQTGGWSSDETESPYGPDGGHVAFLDGHVEWFENINGELTNPVTRRPANSFLQSISQGARVFEDPDKSLLDGREGISGN
jgi:prepilin-type processing-associated H-X9-DG protein